MRIAHVINFSDFRSSDELQLAQKQTLDAIQLALAHTQHEVKIIGYVHERESPALPSFVHVTKFSETIEEVLGLQEGRRLPLLGNMISEAANCGAELCVYSNVDIAVMPHFYDAIADEPAAAFAIHRRRVEADLVNKPMSAGQTRLGRLHTGFDCFVFPAELGKRIDVGKVCIGIPHVGNTLAHVLMAESENFKVLADRHLTYHYGLELEKEWGDSVYGTHNEAEFKRIRKALKPKYDIEKMPGARYGFIKRHFAWLMNPNFSYPLMFQLDMKRGFMRKEKLKKEGSFRQRYLEWLVKRIKLD